MGGITSNYPDLLKPEATSNLRGLSLYEWLTRLMQVLDFDPFVAASTPYPITTYQPKYFCVDRWVEP